MQIIINNKKYTLFCVKDKMSDLPKLYGISNNKKPISLEVLKNGKFKT